MNLIKANPTYPQVDDWIARVHQLMDAYQASHGGAAGRANSRNGTPVPAPTATQRDRHQQQQGDMTIITTHTNSAPRRATEDEATA